MKNLTRKAKRITRKKWIRTLAPSFLLLLCLELTFRVVGGEQAAPLIPDPVLNHTWRPSSRFIHTDFQNRGIPPYTHSYNSEGWLSEREFTQVKPQGTYRIVYFGDSFTEGTCPIEDSVPALVERNLTPPAGKRLEVINTGTSSYSPTLYYLVLKTKILKYQPDLVVVNVDMTDVFDDALYNSTLIVDGEGEPLSCPPGHPHKETSIRTADGIYKLSKFEVTLRSIVYSSAFLRAILKKIEDSKDKTISSTKVPALFAWCDPERSKETSDQVAYTIKMLGRFIRLAKRNGIKVVITGVPHREQLDGRWSLQPMTELETVAAVEGAGYLDSASELRGRLGGREPNQLFIKNDMHFNTLGYQIWAQAQISFLAKFIAAG